MAAETRTDDRITVVFTETEEFGAMNAAEAWCEKHGISVGRMERGKPRGLLYGQYDISKWHNMDRQELAALHGRMTGDMKSGPVHIDVRTPPSVALGAAS